MRVKGTAIAVLPTFIEQRFGSAGLTQWMNALSSDARHVYNGMIMTSEWYPIKESYLEPTALMCELFFKGDSRGARELGRYSADDSLRGVYKAFAKMHSIKQFCDRAVSILHTYYDPCQAKVVLVEDNRAVLQISLFPLPSEYAEQRMAGWIERALEIHGKKNVTAQITQSLARGDACTEFLGTWE